MAAVRRRWLVPAAIVLVTLASLAFAAVIMAGDARTLVAARIQPHWEMLGAAVGLVALNHLAQAGLWHLLSRDLSASGGWLSDLLRFSVSALTRNLPGAFYWSTATRLLMYRADGATAGAALAVGAELVVQLCTGAGLALALLAWPWGLIPGIALVATPLLPPSRTGLLRLSEAVSRRLKRPGLAERAAALAQLSSGTILAVTITDVAVWLIGGLFIQCLGMAIGPELPAWPILYGTWIAASVAGILGSVALGGLGVLREFTLAGLLAPFTGVAAAGLLAVLSRLTLIVGTWASGAATAAVCHLLLKRRKES